MLHTFNDGSILISMTARQLIAIPIWKGNRILDEAHTNIISTGVGSNIQSLDSAIYRIVKYKELNVSNVLVEQKYLIDGQHRAFIIKKHFDENLCVPDFPVVVIEKNVDSETDAIEYFNMLNNVKPQHWNHDPSLLANKYIAAMEAKFNVDKKNPLIRQKGTKRPYLSADKLREMLIVNSSRLKHTAPDIKKFIEAVSKWNVEELKKIQLLKNSKLRLLMKKKIKLISFSVKSRQLVLINI